MLRRLNEKYFLSPKILYLSITLTYTTIAAFRYGFIVDFIGINPTNYAEMYGYSMLISFFSNILIAMAYDKINSPKLFFTGVLCITTIVLQGVCWFGVSMNLFVFWGLMFVYFTFNGSLIPLLDRHVLAMLPTLGGQVKDYGAQRMFGTLACTIGGFLIENVLQMHKGEDKYNYNNLKYYHIFAASIAMLSVWSFIHNINKERETEQTESKDQAISGMQETAQSSSILDILSNFSYMYFIGIMFLNGISRQAMTIFFQNYRTKFLKLKAFDIDHLPGIIYYPLTYTINQNPISTTDSIGTFFEIICFMNSRLITSTLGLYWPLVLGQLAAIIRFTCYYYINDETKNTYILCMFIEVLRGINYGMTHLSGVQLILYMCPLNLRATSQMLYCGVIGLGGAVAGKCSKFLFVDNKMGKSEYQSFFMVNSLLNIACLSMIVIKFGIIDRKIQCKGEEVED